MKLGSHNSWTFAKTAWYIPRFLVECQKLNIQQQYEAGARLFDLRLRFSNNAWVIAHGIAEFKTNWRNDLAWLNEKKDCYIRIVLECTKSVTKEEEDNFVHLCRKLEVLYPNIHFFGGNRKYDWGLLVYFGPDERLIGKYSSDTSLFKIKNKFLSIIDDWCPKLYAKLYNKKNLANPPKDKWLFMDFIGYYG